MQEQLLIYNQIHHYYSALFQGTYDLRYITEQAGICHFMGKNRLQNLSDHITDRYPAFARIYHHQLLLVKFLLQEEQIPDSGYDKKSIQMRDETLGLILHNKKTVFKKRMESLFNLSTYISKRLFDLQWLLPRFTNLQWCLKLPEKIHQHIINHRKIIL